eukprot:CAMPEP_0197848544 /NCGR_PEP_ID=MMETSP1438-20131217/9057_1 /TAXON_ID=1461541 /ORGANISM="Pterosperma sp., Strain CCMP1384" /LENGTH=431 /DNA_ID=CAMNT_0043460839 /DNA_START=40 /DNA_END=1335 /DNA_ORIENTATION=+
MNMKWFFAACMLVTATVQGAQNTDCNIGPDGVEEGMGWAGFENPKAPQVCMTHAGRERCFYFYVPECASENSPLVFDIHGTGSCPRDSAYYTGWATLAKENCFVVVWPLGTFDPALAEKSCFAFEGGITMKSGQPTSNCCCTANNYVFVTDLEPFQDLSFIRKVAGAAVQEVTDSTNGKVTIDTKRIYMAGHSNGCIASHAMASQHSDIVAAVCCHAGTSYVDFAPSYEPVPSWSLHGAKDCDMFADGATQEGYGAIGQIEDHARISAKNGCTEEAQTPVLDGATEIGYTIKSTKCTSGADVTKVMLNDAGHIPYLNGGEFEACTESTPVTIDTTAMAWEFCSAYSKAVAPDLSMAPKAPKPDDKPNSAPKEATTPAPPPEDSSSPAPPPGESSSTPAASASPASSSSTLLTWKALLLPLAIIAVVADRMA